MTTTQNFQIIGIPVTEQEYDRFEQIRAEMLRSGRPLADALHWAACSIGIEAQYTKARAARDEYAALVHAGSLAAPLTLKVSR